ncbi:DegV family protein [Terracoccus luteus]|jgi:DegV family protein with EDD domain|uniref:DegV family protein with EDD domain n=1 Tax=Terracoccus luteus TaxID=53356 RepID=A0A495XX79_9MICO|nr:DegV family protein [Terracoccus luteus]MBB2987044.1 DegV family protein with EDD domain [Terracoccus luteus]MCP2172695.1 DegV family protein with EDD domain [Terracoccus luteus]RKT77093.1 DegV family protein with EDD domain [Terracoccus luteus]
MTVRLVTDSTAYLPDELVAGHAVEVVPLHVVVGGTDHVEGHGVGPEDVAGALRDYTIVTTSRPTPQAFLETYTRLADEGADAVVSVHLSSLMSGTVEAARQAASEAPVPVHVIDSGTLGMAMGFAVLEGARVAELDGELDEVVEQVERRLASSLVLFYVHTLEHLRRGGRIGAASALLGSALSIKPILTVRDGRIVPVEKVRTSSRAIARIEALVAQHVTDGGLAVDVAVHHLEAAERAETVAGHLRALPGVREVVVVQLGAVVGAHVGPGTVAIAVSPRLGEPLPAARP